MNPALAKKLDFKPGAEVEAKAGQLDTDLNRDILRRHMLKQGVQGALAAEEDGAISD